MSILSYGLTGFGGLVADANWTAWLDLIETLPVAELEALGEPLLDWRTSAELMAWLQEKPGLRFAGFAPSRLHHCTVGAAPSPRSTQ